MNFKSFTYNSHLQHHGNMVLNSLPVNQAVGGDSWSAHRMNKTIKLKEELNYEKKNNFVQNIQTL